MISFLKFNYGGGFQMKTRSGNMIFLKKSWPFKSRIHRDTEVIHFQLFFFMLSDINIMEKQKAYLIDLVCGAVSFDVQCTNIPVRK